MNYEMALELKEELEYIEVILEKQKYKLVVILMLTLLIIIIKMVI